MTDHALPRIEIDPGDVMALAPLFQKGVRVDIVTGCTVRSLLVDQWRLSHEYVAGRISTLFLNGKPVDDMETAIVRKGSVLALSSAMPGLVGAVMRSGGFYAAFRDGITYHETDVAANATGGQITVKLFNLLIREIGPIFLAGGFCVNARDLPEDIPHPFDNDAHRDGDVKIVAKPQDTGPNPL